MKKKWLKNGKMKKKQWKNEKNEQMKNEKMKKWKMKKWKKNERELHNDNWRCSVKPGKKHGLSLVVIWISMFWRTCTRRKWEGLTLMKNAMT